MGKDKIIHPENKSSSGIKDTKSSGITEGPSPSLGNLNPYNKSDGKKK